MQQMAAVNMNKSLLLGYKCQSFAIMQASHLRFKAENGCVCVCLYEQVWSSGTVNIIFYKFGRKNGL